MNRSGLGCHIQHAISIPDQVEVQRRGQPRVSKLMEDNPELIRRSRDVNPDCFWNGRIWWPRHKQDVSDPKVAALMCVERIKRQAMVRDVDAWEGFNEPDQWDHLNQAEYECWMAELLHAEELKYVAFNWGVGNPRLEIWKDDIVLEALRLADYLGIHEYCAASLWEPRSFDPPYTDREAYLTTGWWLLRYRRIRAIIIQYLEPWELPEFIITEFGIDSGAPHWDPGAQGGWKSFYGRDEYAQLFTQIAWFDRQIAQDPYLLGFEWFNFGTRDTKNWGTFDMFYPESARDHFTSYLESQIPVGPVERCPRCNQPLEDCICEEPTDWETRALLAEAQLEMTQTTLREFHRILPT